MMTPLTLNPKYIGYCLPAVAQVVLATGGGVVWVLGPGWGPR